jgi:hypothetical protein
MLVQLPNGNNGGYFLAYAGLAVSITTRLPANPDSREAKLAHNAVVSGALFSIFVSGSALCHVEETKFDRFLEVAHSRPERDTPYSRHYFAATEFGAVGGHTIAFLVLCRPNMSPDVKDARGKVAGFMLPGGLLAVHVARADNVSSFAVVHLYVLRLVLLFCNQVSSFQYL